MIYVKRPDGVELQAAITSFGFLTFPIILKEDLKQYEGKLMSSEDINKLREILKTKQ